MAAMVGIPAKFALHSASLALPPPAKTATTPGSSAARVGRTKLGQAASSAGALAAATALVITRRSKRSKVSLPRVALCSSVGSGHAKETSVRELLLHSVQTKAVPNSPSTVTFGKARSVQEVSRLIMRDFEVVGFRQSPLSQSGTWPQATLMSLQGYWEEVTTGVSICVKGNKVDFHDAQPHRELQATADGVCLKDVKLIGGLPDFAIWRRSDGMEMVWVRAPHIAEDPDFPVRFHRFKLCRLVLRSQLVKVVLEEKWEGAAAMMDAWRSTWGGPKDMTPEQELRLAAGRYLVPGVCVRHKIINFRAVVIGCEPFVRAPVAKRLSDRERGITGPTLSYRHQPIYCCLIDDRDAPGGGVAYVPESDLEFTTDFFPLESRFADSLLERHDCIKGYLPATILKQALKRQGFGMPFILREE